MVAAAASVQSQEEAGDADTMKVFGVGLELDKEILDAIAVARMASAAGMAKTVDEVDKMVMLDVNTAVHWSPLLHTVLWVYRASPHNATGLSSALLALGH